MIKRSAAIIMAGSASTAIFARILFTPQISAIDSSMIRSSGAKAREGGVTVQRYAASDKVASARDEWQGQRNRAALALWLC